jgi:hypothetical protein
MYQGKWIGSLGAAKSPHQPRFGRGHPLAHFAIPPKRRKRPAPPCGLSPTPRLRDARRPMRKRIIALASGRTRWCARRHGTHGTLRGHGLAAPPAGPDRDPGRPRPRRGRPAVRADQRLDDPPHADRVELGVDAARRTRARRRRSRRAGRWRHDAGTGARAGRRSGSHRPGIPLERLCLRRSRRGAHQRRDPFQGQLLVRHVPSESQTATETRLQPGRQRSDLARCRGSVAQQQSQRRDPVPGSAGLRDPPPGGGAGAPDGVRARLPHDHRGTHPHLRRPLHPRRNRRGRLPPDPFRDQERPPPQTRAPPRARVPRRGLERLPRPVRPEVRRQTSGCGALHRADAADRASRRRDLRPGAPGVRGGRWLPPVRSHDGVDGELRLVRRQRAQLLPVPTHRGRPGDVRSVGS